MTKLEKAATGLCVLLILVLLAQRSVISGIKDSEQGWKSRFESSDATFGSMVKTIPISALMKSRPDIASLISDSINARPKQVEAVVVTKVIYKKKYIDVPARDTILLIDTIPFEAKYLSIVDSCTSLSIFISDSGKASLVDLGINIPIVVITHWERSKRALWGLIKYGKKIRETTYSSSCPGVTFSESESLDTR